MPYNLEVLIKLKIIKEESKAQLKFHSKINITISELKKLSKRKNLKKMRVHKRTSPNLKRKRKVKRKLKKVLLNLSLRRSVKLFPLKRKSRSLQSGF